MVVSYILTSRFSGPGTPLDLDLGAFHPERRAVDTGVYSTMNVRAPRLDIRYARPRREKRPCRLPER